MTAFTRRGVSLRIGIALLLSLGLLCGAAKTNNNNNNNNANRTPPEKKTIDIPKVDTKPSADAKAALTTAKANQTKAEGALTAIVAKLQKAFDADPKAAAAIAAERSTQVAYDQACVPVVTALQAKSEYKTADANVKTADQAMQTLRNNSDAAPADRLAAAQKLTEAKTVVTKMTVDTLAADPKVSAAKAKHAAAAAALGKLRKDFEDSLKNNAEWLAAKKAVDDAKTETLAAQKTYDDATKELAKQQAAHNAAVSQQAQADADYKRQMAAYNQSMNQSSKTPAKGKKG